eukprot:9483226-Pyramimonas_sp.AAC.2
MAGVNTAYLSNADAPAFPLNYGQLVKLSKELIETKFGTAKPELLAEDFEFRFPVVELNKARFVEAFASFKLDEAFPDMHNAYYGAAPHKRTTLRTNVRCTGPDRRWGCRVVC